MDGAESNTFAGIEVPPEQRTPLVERLLRIIAQQQSEIQQQRNEIARLKGLSARPKIRPSTLNEPHPDPSHKKRKRRGKRPGSAKRRKTRDLVIHETLPVQLDGLPESTRQNGYEDFVVQDLNIEAHNIRDRRLRYLLPAGPDIPCDVATHGPELFLPPDRHASSDRIS